MRQRVILTITSYGWQCKSHRAGGGDASWCKRHKKGPALEGRSLYSGIGLAGFEPATPSPPDLYAKPLRYSPECQNHQVR